MDTKTTWRLLPAAVAAALMFAFAAGCGGEAGGVSGGGDNGGGADTTDYPSESSEKLSSLRDRTESARAATDVHIEEARGMLMAHNDTIDGDAETIDGQREMARRLVETGDCSLLPDYEDDPMNETSSTDIGAMVPFEPENWPGLGPADIEQLRAAIAQTEDSLAENGVDSADGDAAESMSEARQVYDRADEEYARTEILHRETLSRSREVGRLSTDVAEEIGSATVETGCWGL